MHIDYSVTISLQEEKKIRKLLLNKKKFFTFKWRRYNALKVQEDVSYLFKQLNAPYNAKKGKRIGSNKVNSVVLQLSVSYVQKTEKWFHTLHTRNINKWEKVTLRSRGLGKNRKLNKCHLRLLDAYEYSSSFKTEMNNHKWEL